MMKRVARRVALNLSESKRLSILNENVFNPTGVASGSYRFKSIFGQLPTATGANVGASYATVGNEIVDPLVKFKASLTINWASMLSDPVLGQRLNYGSIYAHIFLIACNDYANPAGGATPPGQLFWSKYPGLFSAEDPGWFLNDDSARPTLNGNNVKLIRRWSKKYHPPPQHQRISPGDAGFESLGITELVLQGKHKFRGKLTFEDNPFGDVDSNFPRSGTLRGWNYYWLVGWGAQGIISVPAQPQINMDQFVYYKDP